MSLGTLSVDLIMKTGGFEQNIAEAERKLKHFERTASREFQQIANDAQQLGSRMALLGTAIGVPQQPSVILPHNRPRLSSRPMPWPMRWVCPPRSSSSYSTR